MAIVASPHEVHPIRSEQDVVLVRQAIRALCAAAGFGSIDQTKLLTAASELARNALIHGGGGSARLERVEDGRRRGVRIVFEDRGPGIPDIARALEDGYTTARSLGLGLGGARRLVNEFEVVSRPGEGTRVTVLRWAAA